MGTWLKGYKVVAGTLMGSTFEDGGDLDDPTWANYPNPSATQFTITSGYDMSGMFAGIGCKLFLTTKVAGDEFTLWGLDVDDPDEYKVQIRLKMRCFRVGGFECSLIRRVYTDDTTYTDQVLANRQLGFYFNDPNMNTEQINAVFFTGTYNGNSYLYTGFSWKDLIYWSQQDTYTCDGFSLPTSQVSNVLGGDPADPIEYSPEFGKKAKKKGGYNPDHHRKGTFDDSSDRIDVDTKPYNNPFRTGFINGYYVNPTQLAKLSQALFPEPGLYTADVPQMIYNLYQSILNSKRVDYVLDLLIVPVTPVYRTETVMNCGGRPLYILDPQDPSVVDEVKGNPIDDCFVDFDCGRLNIPEYWANFLDFVGTKVKLFLPYVGYVDIEPEYINGGELHIWYRFNVFDGSFMAYVESTSGHSELEESLISQYAGVAAIHIPVTGQDYSNKVSGLISAIGSIAAGAAGGGALAPAAIGAAASLGNTVLQKPGTSHSNGYNASSSYLSHRTPYIIIERQSSQFSEKYPEEVGLPLYMEMRLGDCHGLTIAKNAHLDTIPADVEVKEKISQLLSEGIIL